MLLCAGDCKLRHVQKAIAVNCVNLRKLKEFAIAKLKPTSQLRMIILSEPDYVPQNEARIKAPFYAKMLYNELEANAE